MCPKCGYSYSSCICNNNDNQNCLKETEKLKDVIELKKQDLNLQEQNENNESDQNVSKKAKKELITYIIILIIIILFVVAVFDYAFFKFIKYITLYLN
jgi:t-SNARE complex subunit (syntaxin)